MSRKKSRKVGQIGIRSVPKEERQRDVSPSRSKKKVGNASGSRHSAKVEKVVAKSGSGNKDPRLGSKKAVPLIVEAPKEKAKNAKKYFSPKEELKAIEDDARLIALLDKADSGQKLSIEQQKYVDEKLARHKVLCELLGIEIEEEPEETQPDQDDPLARFDAIDPNEFK